MSRVAELRVCASCEWIYKGKDCACPKCGFGSYGARYVYGDICYTWQHTQKPWYDKKMANFSCGLVQEIIDADTPEPFPLGVLNELSRNEQDSS